MKIGIASDHRGVEIKKKLIEYLEKKGHFVVNYGVDATVSVDYPEYAFLLGSKVLEGEVESGILVCGTGIGMNIAANRLSGIRCAKVDHVKEAFFARNHNDANMITLSSYMPIYQMKDILDVFLETPFSNEERHVRRISQIEGYRD